MSGSRDKKIRQLYNREVRGSFNIWQQTVREKPRFMPVIVWALVLRIVFKPNAADILKGIKSTDSK